MTTNREPEAQPLPGVPVVHRPERQPAPRPVTRPIHVVDRDPRRPAVVTR